MAKGQPSSPLALMFDMNRLRRRADAEFLARLDKEFQERKRLHELALAAAAEKHDSVRQDAEIVSKRIERETREMWERAEAAALQAENERRQREMALEADRLRKEKADRELAARRREIAEAQRLEEEQKRIEDTAKAAAAAERQRQAERDAQIAKEARECAEEEERRIRATQPVQNTNQQSRPDGLVTAPVTAISTGVTHPSRTDTGDPLHLQYLDLHKRLKECRKSVLDYAKGNIDLKKKAGGARREIRTRIGQLVEGRGANKVPSGKIIAVLREARQDTLSPRVDVRQYILENSSPNNPTNVDPQVPSLFLYALNMFAKIVISQFVNEAAVSPKSADPIGVLVAQIFANKDFQWGERSLIDILMTKFHVHCPVLFGVYGSEQTDAGKTLLGWARQEKGGPWVTEQRHSERMTGLGAGYAAIGLRNFSKSALKNPYPNWHYWQSLQWIITVPSNQVTRTHFMVLKAMIENYEKRFIDLYGRAAVAAMRVALIDFPNRAIEKSAAVAAVAVLPDVLKRDKKLTL